MILVDIFAKVGYFEEGSIKNYFKQESFSISCVRRGLLRVASSVFRESFFYFMRAA